MSPRAAWRLERLGFAKVCDYAAGKVDWMAAGLPTVRRSRELRAVDVADRDPPTCRPTDLVRDLPTGARVLVVNDARVVLGRIDPREPTQDVGARAEDAMQPGPATVRAHEALAPLVEWMLARSVREIVVTTPEGRLLGVVRRGDADRALRSG